MIIEDRVSVEIAQLLKEKGFDENCTMVYNLNNQHLLMADFYCGVGNFAHNSYLNKERPELITAPTLQIATKWLREEHNILIVVDYEWECDTTPYYFKIYRLGENGKPERVAIKGVSYDKDDNPTEHIVGYRDWERSCGDYSTYEEACEVAIKHCLENLI